MPRDTKIHLIAVVGPTASGKSDLAVEIARRFNGEVISADSRQIYRGLDIGSGKITKREMKGIPHYLLDVASPKRPFSVMQYKRLAERAIRDIVHRGKVPILCGGTGFYIQAVISGITIPEVPPDASLRAKLEKKSAKELFIILKKLDSRRAKEIDKDNPRRLVRAIEIATKLGAVPTLTHTPPPYRVLQIGINPGKDILTDNIAKRLTARMKKGMLAEGRRLHAEGLSWKRMRSLGLEYRMMADVLTDTLPQKEAEEKLLKEIIQFSRRQMVWFKRDTTIRWFKKEETREVFKEVKKFLV